MATSKIILITLVLITVCSTLFTGGILIQQHITNLGINPFQEPPDIVLGIAFGYTIAHLKVNKLDISCQT